MTQLGFRYDTHQYAYVKKEQEDVVVNISYATQSGNRKDYYRLVIYVELFYNPWNRLLAKLTDGCANFDSYSMGVIYFPTTLKYTDEHVTFTSERTMEKNLAEFQKELEMKVFPIVKKYADKQQLYDALFTEKDTYLFNQTKRWFLPIACYMFGDYKKSLSYANKFLEECQENLHRVHDSPGFRNTLDVYSIYFTNLKNLIHLQ